MTAMAIERINPGELPRPSGFSHAVIGTGTIVFLAGQTALNVDGHIVGDDIVDQFEQALANLLAALRAAGGEPDQLASLTIYVTDLRSYRARAADIGQVWRRLVGPAYPAMAAIGVTQLWDTQAQVELQGFAVL
jgi:enamine deaminase RidA (YjgF/YER057c/UK114 family)